MELTKFQESLLVFSAMKTTIENDLRVFKRYIHDEDLKFSLHNKMIIDICSFLSEFKRFNTYAKTDTAIRETLRITSFATKRLKKWNDLEGMRNTMLAHGHRDDHNSGKLTSLNDRYFNANVPTTYAEVMLLSEYCVYIISTFICRHFDDHKLALSSIPKMNTEVERGILTNKEFEADVLALQNDLFAKDPTLRTCFGL